MKLKGRLLTAFLIITTIPLLLVCLSLSLIIGYQNNEIKQTYDVKTNSITAISNPVQLLSRLTRGVYNEIVLTAAKAPAKFEEEEYIAYLEKELKGKYSYLVIRKGNDYIYTGNDKRFSEIKENIPAFGEHTGNAEGGLYVDGSSPFLLKQQDFYYSDGTEGSIFIITELDTLIPQIKASAIQLLLSLISIIILTASVLIIWIYRSIIIPINTLHAATNAMKEGNLDYSIEGDPEDEIGQLCVDFEEMRIQLKELIDVRLRYEQEMKELISNISHDLRTPITAIKGYAEGIMDGVADTKEKQEKYIKTIYTKANDLSVLVDELSFYSKIDCDTMPYTFSCINLGDYFEDCLGEITLDLEVKNIEVEYHNDTDNDTKVNVDAEQLKRVISNIVGNSVKYMGNRQGHIDIRIMDGAEFNRAEEVVVSIGDNGVGISARDLPFIFERFYRADASRNSTRGGTGLGLAIVKKIIEDHMGTIWAESEEDNGTTVYFTLRKCKEDVKNEQDTDCGR
ncbi:sensor histidine kinase [Anaerocolumna xylanovorans]|uniref:histidine kinase n=1 Tax=Anaerocolumna xylanovorans DSM 12503 TaxID=1121345 RepID=A0A1M7YK50_9FIRM|nr:HAMP domain-containing sensor histidine kinase [Anaerocolumna xylanovorans]SHO53011.1 Signal transduction histidine kinase [Anaerocolumna xylanovorans DSM 12503]